MKSCLLALALAACAPLASQDAPGLVLPPRATNAPTGQALLASLRGLALTDRETLLAHELAAGNVPDFLRVLEPVTTSTVLGGRLRTARFWVARDVLGFGADGDWFRMPMTPTLAQSCADRLACVLPTRRMSDAIWAAAPVKLAPFPYSPTTYDILSVELFHAHHLQIESQRSGTPRSAIVAGIKKDVVASALVAANPGRVVIYGWHRTDGTPIQPLSKVHTFPHVDYSHGIRLVAKRMEVDGVPTTVDAVLADPVLHPLLSDEGPIPAPRYPASSAESFPLHDPFPGGVPRLAVWRPKFRAPTPVATLPPPPSGDAAVLRVLDPAGGTESLRLETGLVRDVVVQADLLCTFRPELASDGFERIGIFVRDRAGGAFDGTLSQAGACYALTWDSHDGRLRCLRAQGGVLTDLLPSPRFVTGTAWRRFRVEAKGARLAFFLDGAPVADLVDATHPDGAFGIGYHEYFTTNAHALGTRVDTFHADVPGAFTFAMRPGFTVGELELHRARGMPGDLYVSALTLHRGAFPNGWFHGVDIPLPELLGLVGSGHPAFVGLLSANGDARLVVGGVPGGFALHGVSVAVDPGLGILMPSPPVVVTTR